MSVAVMPAVSLEELRRVWRSVQDGTFRTPAARRLVSRCAPVVARGSWEPDPGEVVLPVVGCSGSSGASTVALALATAAGEPARVVECSSPSASGFAGASQQELGVHPSGWVQGRRDMVLLERSDRRLADVEDVPEPSPGAACGLTVVDVAFDLEQVLAGAGWVSGVLACSPVVVVSCRGNVPSVRRLEGCLDLLGVERSVVAVVGGPRRTWSGPVWAAAGTLTRRLIAEGRSASIPEDHRLALRGLGPDPLPAPVIKGGRVLLSLAKGLLS